MRSALRWAMVPLALLVVGSVTQADAIVNGSFETPTVPAGSYSTYTTGSTSITGWTVVGSDVSVVSGTYTQSDIVFEAQNGQQWLDLTGPGTNSMANGLTQNALTTIGQRYQLSFYVGSATDNSAFFASTVDLSINSGARVSYTNPTAPTTMLDWRLFNVEFTATSTSTNITFYNGSASNNNLSGLDNVSLNAVPEPSSLVLLGIGVGGMAIGIARRRRASGSGDKKAESVTL